MDELFKFVMDKAPWVSYILMALGSLMVLAQIIVPLTPTLKDDEFMNKSFMKKLMEFFVKFAPFQKKDK